MSVLEGLWDIAEATLPNGEPGYSGTIGIRRVGSHYLLYWDITAGKYVGVGIPTGAHLFVACAEQFAGLGIALLRTDENGHFNIRWCNGVLPGLYGTGTSISRTNGGLEGKHEIVQLLPDGRLYGEWVLSIKRSAAVYELTWERNGVQHMKGLGLETDWGIAAGWYADITQLAVLQYVADSEDASCMKAVWALGGSTSLGTEILRLRREVS